MRERLSVPEQDYGKLSVDQKYQQWKEAHLTESMPKDVFDILQKQHTIN